MKKNSTFVLNSHDSILSLCKKVNLPKCTKKESECYSTEENGDIDTFINRIKCIQIRIKC